jgi:hypothetical protein
MPIRGLVLSYMLRDGLGARPLGPPNEDSLGVVDAPPGPVVGHLVGGGGDAADQSAVAVAVEGVVRGAGARELVDGIVATVGRLPLTVRIAPGPFLRRGYSAPGAPADG